jgi:hypothetical protein
MPQLSLYLDRETLALVQQSAERRHQSLSGFVSDLIRDKVTNRWPEGYWGLYGSVTDDSFVRPEQTDFSLDVKRGAL